MTWILVLAYVVSVVVAAVPLTRTLAEAPYCHRDYDWDRKWCLVRHGGNCWRSDNRDASLGLTLLGFAAALLWPISAALLIVKSAASPTENLPRADRKRIREEKRRIALEAAIADAEREAGIR